MAHTNFPWFCGVTVVWDKDKRAICQMEKLDRSDEEVQANACLISKAPELLEELNNLCETLHPIVMRLDINEGFKEHAALAQARTLILKAQGN